MKAALIISACLFASGCAQIVPVVNEAEQQKYDPASTARIRVYSNPNIRASYTPGKSCEEYKANADAEVSRKKGQVNLLGMSPGQYENEVIGMRPSWHSAHLSYREKYSELVLPAGVPTVISIISFQGVMCNAPARSFTPRAGKDYEAYLAFQTKHAALGICQVVIQELSDRETPEPDEVVKTGICVPVGESRLGNWRTENK
ncbi:hypothetical protein [Pseudomonas sp. RIT-PI-r]|jgi:hypothetical protein|uniref:hypothetical protein n=1 Tax=Pseudomonas sp. RIT-PI-r TaxID=1699620 RepID=UPI0006D70098|nr:hypothetical protein [Pseudomonas sp. RIT-PI-r]KPG98864.1 hypothetical protein AK821_07945 [Pseudomonas sp. RIT-PI-r]